MGLNVIVHYPTSEEGKAELSKRVAEVHAELVYSKLRNLKCPTEQKLQLLDAVIKTAKERELEKPRSSSG